MIYNIKFTGRLIGAIGITYPMQAVVVAESEQAAIAELYETYENVHNISVKEENCHACGQCSC